MINTERLVDYVIQSNEESFDYHRSSAIYIKSHGHGVFLNDGRKLSKDEEHIRYAYHSSQAADDSVYAICEVLNLDKEGRSRLYSAARAVSRWYRRTNYERCLPDSLLDDLTKFIFS